MRLAVRRGSMAAAKAIIEKFGTSRKPIGSGLSGASMGSKAESLSVRIGLPFGLVGLFKILYDAFGINCAAPSLLPPRRGGRLI